MRYDIIALEDIKLDKIEPHPRNPRPTFHLSDEDVNLKELAESIATQGQHKPAVVYQKDDGNYRLYQGERRWRACKIGGLDTLKAFVVPAPANDAQDLAWLGVEEAFKQGWQKYFHLKYCWELAEAEGVRVDSLKIANNTGVSMQDLKIASKIFRLEPIILAHVEEYERLLYEHRAVGKAGRVRIKGAGIKVKEFPVQKAALVWDVFEAARQYAAGIVNNYDDQELQQWIARKATSGAGTEDLTKLLGLIRQLDNNPPVGTLKIVTDFFRMKDKSVKQTLQNAGVANSDISESIRSSSGRMMRKLIKANKNYHQLGNDPDELRSLQEDLISLQRSCMDLERNISDTIRKIERR